MHDLERFKGVGSLSPGATGPVHDNRTGLKRYPSTIYISATLMLVGSHALAESTRTWTDSTGSFSIDAEFVSVMEDKVQLRRKDGRLIVVPIKRLSEADKQFLTDRGDIKAGPEPIPDNAPTDYRSLSRMLDDLRSAKDAIKLLEAFMASPEVANSEKATANSVLELWRKRAEDGLIQHGGTWLSREELSGIEKNEIRLLREAHRLIDVSNDRLALERFQEASKLNLEGVRADFYLGLLNALVAKYPLDAADHFSECEKRLQRFPDRLIGSRRANLVAALNNLALAEVRLARHDRARRHWEEALTIAPRTPELVQNLGLMSQVAETHPHIRISRALANRFGDLYASAAVANAAAEFDVGVGWLYMPYIDSMDGSMTTEGDNELHPVSWASGVAIGKELVLTTSFAIADADRYQLRNEAGSVAGEGKLIAVDPELNLAVLRFRGLEAKPATWSRGEVPIGTELQLLGYRSPGRGSTAMQSVEANVLQEKTYSPLDATVYFTRTFDNNQGFLVATRRVQVASARRVLLTNVVADSALIGGPLCDARGAVFGLHLGAVANQAASDSKSSLAERSYAVLEFLAQLQSEDAATVDNAPVESEIAQPLGGAKEKLANSVFQVIGLKIAPRLAWSHRIAKLHALKQQGDWTSYEDRTCMLCNGSRTRPCTNRRCSGGTIPRRGQRQIGTDPRTGRPIMAPVTTRETCTTCNGRDGLPCPSCTDGNDQFLGSAR